MSKVKSSLASAETWIGAGGAIAVYDAPSGLHALAVSAVLVAFIVCRSWVKVSA